MAISHRQRTLKVVICHAPEDAVRARFLYDQIRLVGVSPWLAEEDVHAGQDKYQETRQAIQASNVVILTFSQKALEQAGPFWREVRWILEAAEEKEEGAIFVIPVRLEECNLPSNLEHLRPVNWFEPGGYDRLVRALQARANKLGIVIKPEAQDAQSEMLQPLAETEAGIDPYLGLKAFQAENADFFFGREVFVNQLEVALAQKPLVAVVGPSGSGKSSVVFAGLIPRLQQTSDWQAVIFRPGDKPFRALAAALLQALEPSVEKLDRVERQEKISKWENSLQQGKVTLCQLVQDFWQENPGTSVLLVADQFEELYTLCKEDEEREAFLNFVLAAVPALPPTRSTQSSPSLRLVLTLRADFFGYALLHRPFADALQSAQQNLGPMEPEELRRAIERPVWRLGVEIEQGLTERILAALKQAPGNLPLLEFALTQLWERREVRPNGEARLTHAAYEAIGGVEQAIARYADAEYAKLSEAEQQQAQRIFVQLVQPGAGTQDTRRVALKQEVGEANWELVRRLADTRLVVSGRDEASGQETAEVVHEALLSGWGLLRQWMSADRTFRTWQERLRAALRQWEASQRDEGALLRGAPLAEAEDWLQKREAELSQGEKAFIQTSLELRDQEQKEREEQQRQRAEAAEALVKSEQKARFSEQKGRKRQRSFLIGLSFLLLIAIATSIIATIFARVANEQTNVANTQKAEAQRQADIANTQAKISKSQSLSAYAQSILDTNPEASALMAAEAARLANSPATLAALPQADSVLRQFLSRSALRSILSGHTNSVNSGVFSPDGTKILTTSADKTARLWSASDGKLLATLSGHTDYVNSGVFSPDGTKILTTSDDKTARLWLILDKLPFITLSGHTASVNSGVFSPDGTKILTTSPDKTARLWSTSDGKLLATLSGHTASVYRGVFSPDGTKILTTSDDKTAIVQPTNVGDLIKLVESRVTRPFTDEEKRLYGL